MIFQKRRFWFALIVSPLLPHLGSALAQVPFYQGKTITIVQSRAAGGTGDGYVRSIIPFLEKYIPGNPRIVIEYMPGAGGRMQANHMYAVARPDGLTIGSGSGGIITNGILDTVGVRYDLDKFIISVRRVATHNRFLRLEERRASALLKSFEPHRASNRRPIRGFYHLC